MIVQKSVTSNSAGGFGVFGAHKKSAGLLPDAWVKIVIPARLRAGRHVFSPMSNNDLICLIQHTPKVSDLFKPFSFFIFFLSDRSGFDTPGRLPPGQQIFTA